VTIRTLALIGLLGLGTTVTIYTPPADARAYISLNINTAPPPPRYERVVVREGYVWAPGYWRWEGHRHVWVEGYWLRQRPGYLWVGPRWEQYNGGWRFHEGYWNRGDGHWDHDHDRFHHDHDHWHHH
jgi:hypothetical protein